MRSKRSARTIAGGVVTFMLSALGPALAANMITATSAQAEPVVCAGNGRTYEFVPGSFTWDQANDAAAAAGGRLATISSAEENACVSALIPQPQSAWLGGLQPAGAERSEPGGGWKWTTGEPFGPFVNWTNISCCHEPNDAGGGVDIAGHEDHLGMSNYFDRVGSWFDISGAAQFGYVVEYEAPAACPVPNLDPVSGLASLFESAAPGTPPFSLIPPAVESLLDAAARNLEFELPALRRTSGFRPVEYQRHWHQLLTRTIALRTAYVADPANIAACAGLQATIDREIDVVHGIMRNAAPPHLPLVSLPSQSAHTVTDGALAIDYNVSGAGIALPIIELAAAHHRLYRPCEADLVHFSIIEVPCVRTHQTLRFQARSPIDMLVTTPSGARVGFEPVEKRVVNELGDLAYYSGPGTEPQVIDIGDAEIGVYQLTAIGVGSGPYTINVNRLSEDGEVLESAEYAGTATPGAPIPEILASVTGMLDDFESPILTLPDNITTRATTAAGAAVEYVASAVDMIDGNVELACNPSSGSVFPIGTTTVECRATDMRDNSATGSFGVTVEAASMSGEMTGDGFIGDRSARYHFKFRASAREPEDGRGRFQLQVQRTGRGRRDDRFTARNVSFMAFSDDPSFSPGPRLRAGVDSVMFQGRGEWNGRDGYTYRVRATDQGEPGRHRETIDITIWDANGAVVVGVTGKLDGGNIQSKRVKH